MDVCVLPYVRIAQVRLGFVFFAKLRQFSCYHGDFATTVNFISLSSSLGGGVETIVKEASSDRDAGWRQVVKTQSRNGLIGGVRHQVPQFAMSGGSGSGSSNMEDSMGSLTCGDDLKRYPTTLLTLSVIYLVGGTVNVVAFAAIIAFTGYRIKGIGSRKGWRSRFMLYQMQV